MLNGDHKNQGLGRLKDWLGTEARVDEWGVQQALRGEPDVNSSGVPHFQSFTVFCVN